MTFLWPIEAENRRKKLSNMWNLVQNYRCKKVWNGLNWEHHLEEYEIDLDWYTYGFALEHSCWGAAPVAPRHLRNPCSPPGCAMPGSPRASLVARLMGKSRPLLLWITTMDNFHETTSMPKLSANCHCFHALLSILWHLGVSGKMPCWCLTWLAG